MPKSKKDPNKPKGAKSGYIFFVEQERADRAEKDESVAFTELSKICGPLWQRMSEEDKAPFLKLSEKDKRRYAKEMESYIPPDVSDSDSDDDQPKRKKKKPKDPNAPKKNITAYFHFAAEKRPEIKAEYDNLSVTEVATKIGAKWRELTAADKEPFEKLAKKDKERYLIEIAEYQKAD